MTSLYIASLFLPLAAAIFAILFRNSKEAHLATQLLFAASGACGVGAAIMFFMSGQPVVPIFATAMFSFAISPFAAFFLALVSLGVLLTSVYAIESLNRYRDIYSLPWLALATALFIVGMQSTLMMTTVVGFLIAWELMSIAAYFLVIADREEESLNAGFSYFIMTHIGFAALVAGFLILAGGYPLATWHNVMLTAAALPQWALTLAFGLLFVGFGSKAGLVPLHQWLPQAHPQAPSHASALLSGVMLKVALFGFIQSLFLFPSIPLSWGIAILVVGLASAFFGVLHAVVESDIKRALAWSSIENMGLIFSAVGASVVVRAISPEIGQIISEALTIFVVLHVINHFLFKSGLFMAAGAVASSVHSRDMDRMGGLAQRWPLFSGIFLVLALSAAALPPLGTFFGEWMYLQSLAVMLVGLPFPLSIGAGLMLAILAGVSGLAVFAFVKMFSSVFLGRARSEHAEHAGDMSRLLMWPPLVCAALSVLSGFFAFPYLAQMFSVGGALTDRIAVAEGASVNAWALAIVVGIFAVALVVIARSLKVPVRITDTWDCGQPLTPRMEYTGTGFSAPIRFFFRSFLVTRKELVATPVSPRNRWIAAKRLDWSVTSAWERYLYLPVGDAFLTLAGYVRRLQSGVIQMYLLLVVIALITAFVFAL